MPIIEEATYSAVYDGAAFIVPRGMPGDERAPRRVRRAKKRR